MHRDFYLPQMYEPRLSPRCWTMYAATHRFSVPWSPHTWLGRPCLFTASRKRSSMVAALLLVLHLISVMKCDFPSIKPWITNFHLISSERVLVRKVRDKMKAYCDCHRGARGNLHLELSISSSGLVGWRSAAGLPALLSQRPECCHERPETPWPG